MPLFNCECVKMYFQIENTPEHIEKLTVPEDPPKEECPRLVLAPFSRPPHVVFENVVIGSTCERTLEVFNPSKKPQQITLNRSLPAGLIAELPGERLEVEPETCYCLNLIWTPRHPTVLRDTIRFSNENRGRYDVIVVLKTALAVKSQTTKPKVSKTPGIIKKKVQKKSPVAIHKQKPKIIYNATKIKQTVNILKTTEHSILRPSNKHNMKSDESDFRDSLTTKNSNKENETHSIISKTSTQPANKWVSNNYNQKDYVLETPVEQTSKIPNTSSPKDFNSPNFSINTELSRISDMSFFPQRLSTDRKGLLKMNNETQEIADDTNFELGSDTSTKESLNHVVNFQMYTVEPKPPNIFMREQPKICREETYTIKGTKYDVKFPTRSTSPNPLQSIPEESMQMSETQLLDKTDKQIATFTINRTIDKDYPERPSSSCKRLTWSKKAFHAEPNLWKIPTPISKKPQMPKINNKTNIMLSSKLTNKTYEARESINNNLSIPNHIGNVYSQSSTMDPFLSSTYFYDEEAVDKFESESKRWLNCILTPPSDLDSNIERKIDVGKAWLENRNREVPLAPTKEQVCSVYNNSHRLENLRRSARILFMSPDITLVFQKLNAQIENKIIAIRSDRNLHLDIGLQKIIMELLLSYNPLWLRIGLEAIYGTVLPLKSNSDIEGLTTFIIQRMFKNPYLKSKNSKSTVPNMFLPAYLRAIKKFTLKKFFMLVYFLDQAKQRKLISHDPCLFCRNAFCKESREVIIRFTRELIAGIGDITKHLRPLGYIVSHKQSYLDEYKYAVHNITIDLRDGVRLTKVMEIILMKTGLLHQLRTPAISRLQKIHNVALALSALKEANFTIVGDITSYDIADGHREKTLSLLWQLIHVFRAPLFEKAAKVIQLWWKKKYQVIVEKRKEEQNLRLTNATITIQRAYRKHRANRAAAKIQAWYRGIKLRNIYRQNYLNMKKCAIVIQSELRMFKTRSEYLRLKHAAITIQRAYRNHRRNKAASKIQLWYKSILLRNIVRRQYLKLKTCTIIIQSRFRMIKARSEYLRLRSATVRIQRAYRLRKWNREHNSNVIAIIKLQAHIRCYIARSKFLRIRRAALLIQAAFRLKQRREFTKAKREAAAVCIQKNVRRYLCRSSYLKYRKCVITVQRLWRGKLLTRQLKFDFMNRKNMIIKLQAIARGYLARKRALLKRNSLLQFKKEEALNLAASKIQALFRGNHIRMKVSDDLRITELRRRWRDGALISCSLTLKERNEEAMDVLCNMSDIQTVIRALRTIELLTVLKPMMYNSSAASIVRRLYVYMSFTNRSIPSIEVLKSGASILVNLTRYSITGPNIYVRERIPPILKFMLRFCNSETHLFCILCTYVWLFSKYNEIKQDLKELLHLDENHKVLTTIRGNVDRMKRMSKNVSRSKFNTQELHKFVSHTSNHLVNQGNHNKSIVFPSLEPDYGIIKAEKPRYFEDPHQAMKCLFQTYDL